MKVLQNRLNMIISFIIGEKEYTVVNLFMGIVASAYAYLSSHMYDDPLAVHALLIAYILDFLTALYKCKVNNIKIKSSKLPRFIYHLLFIAGILTFSWYLSKTSLVFYFLPSLIYGGCMSQQLLSILENLGEANVINNNFLKYYKELIIIRYLKGVSDDKESKQGKELIDSVINKQPLSNDYNNEQDINGNN